MGIHNWSGDIQQFDFVEYCHLPRAFFKQNSPSRQRKISNIPGTEKKQFFSNHGLYWYQFIIHIGLQHKISRGTTEQSPQH